MSQQAIPYPTGIWRSVARLPLLLYRFGLGWLLRPLPFLILTTRGRRSGLPRHAVLEYRRHGRKLYVVSAWGQRPHWVQNLMANSQATVQLGADERGVTAHRVEDPAEALRALYMFQRTSRLYDLLLASMSSADTIDLRTLIDVSDEFTVLRFDVQPGPAPLPGVQVTNRWLGPLLLALCLLTVLRIVSARFWTTAK